jgi:thiamine biosynthesis lipoprotein
VKFFSTTFRAMACDNEVQLFAADPQLAARAAELVMAEVKRIEQKYSRYRDDSVTTRINQDAGTRATAIDAETAALLRHADACFRISGGLFDLTSGVLRKVWDFRTGVVPSAAQIETILPLVGWSQLELGAEHLYMPRSGMELDFGGIGKEYAVDCACQVLQQLDIKHALVSLGGDVRIIGPRPDGSPWPVYIAHPRKPGEIIATMHLGQGAVTTSGDYQRFFEREGKRYCHILNPATGQPVDTWQSASVLSALCVDAGSISTIAMLMEQDALTFLEQRGENALLIDQSGRTHGFNALESLSSPGAFAAGHI